MNMFVRTKLDTQPIANYFIVSSSEIKFKVFLVVNNLTEIISAKTYL